MTDTTAPVDGGQGAPSATPATTGTVPTNTPATTSLEWLAGASEETSTYVQNKGWKAPTDMLTSYQQLEKHMGTPAEKLLRLPDWDKAEKSELDQFYNKIGRPSDPSGYEIAAPQGADSTMVDWAKPVFHEAGLTKQQAKIVTEKWNEHIAGLTAKQTESYAQTIAQQNAELKSEWGAAYEQELGMAKNAAKSLGIKPEQIDALEGSLGFANLMKMMSNIGKRIGEDKFVDGGSSSGNGAMTPAGAKARITQLQGDKDWTAKYLSGNVQARAEMERLMQFAYPT